MGACSEALDPRPFDDRYFEQIYRDLPQELLLLRSFVLFSQFLSLSLSLSLSFSVFQIYSPNSACT